MGAALLSLLILGRSAGGFLSCAPTELSAELERYALGATETIRAAESSHRNLETRSRWKSILPAVSLQTYTAQRISGWTGAGHRFYSEYDSETVILAGDTGGELEDRTTPSGLTVLATWNLAPLIFSSDENAARVFRRDSYVRARRRTGELMEDLESARAAIRRLESGTGDVGPACIDARVAVDRLKSYQ